ncbi:MAG: GNAT family N-acetyltransferase [Acidiferrobacterales bacterium]|nr:GNAT family N-acetyltransferase [Acidiferrobacterales bacterium]
MIRNVSESDIEQLTAIYNYYIEHSIATFEEQLIAANEMQSRVRNIEQDNFPWLVAEDDNGNIAGYAYASHWNPRSAYRFTAEVTVYLSEKFTGHGIGSQLYQVLFSLLKKQSYENVIAGISLPNEASVALHEKFNMQQVGDFKKIGFKFGEWVDVGYWQGQLK